MFLSLLQNVSIKQHVITCHKKYLGVLQADDGKGLMLNLALKKNILVLVLKHCISVLQNKPIAQVFYSSFLSLNGKTFLERSLLRDSFIAFSERIKLTIEILLSQSEQKSF